MNLELKEGLLKLGDSVSAVYKRLSRASADEKAKLGFSEDENVFANIGIASVEEYVVISVNNIPKNYKAVFDLSQFQQPMMPVAMYINDPKEDAVNVELYLPDGTQITAQRFSRNKTPIDFPAVPLPPQVTIKVKAFTQLAYIYLVLKPVVILESVEGYTEDANGNSNNPIGGGSNNPRT